MKIKITYQNLKILHFRLSFCILIFAFCILSSGCEAFVRKFTRKPKKDKGSVEVVLAPEEFKGPEMTKEEIYRKYLLYWQVWQDELIQSLSEGISHKKRIDCAQEALNNLEYLRSLVKPEKYGKLDGYLKQLQGLKEEMGKDLYGRGVSGYKVTAERMKRDILRDFSYQKVKDYLQ